MPAAEGKNITEAGRRTLGFASASPGDVSAKKGSVAHGPPAQRRAGAGKPGASATKEKVQNPYLGPAKAPADFPEPRQGSRGVHPQFVTNKGQENRPKGPKASTRPSPTTWSTNVFSNESLKLEKLEQAREPPPKYNLFLVQS